MAQQGQGTPVFQSVGGDISAATVSTDGGTTSRTAAALASAVDAASTVLTTVTATGATDIAIPSSGNSYFIVNATADTQLQFTGTAAKGEVQKMTLEISANGFTVTLPTTNVAAISGVTVPATISDAAGKVTIVHYQVRDGWTTILAGL